MSARYDAIGRTYACHRRSDPRIAATSESALDGCTSVVNVGAGTGCYEPAHLAVVAVEPSQTIIDQRPAGSAPCVKACVESLPFPDRCFDAVMGVMTVHHWSDLRPGLADCARVARKRGAILTTDMEVVSRFWLMD